MGVLPGAHLLLGGRMEYPHMLYKDGEIGEDWVIVYDAEEEAKAVKHGYIRHGAPKPDKRKAKQA
jgi:hypothetical protein